MKVEHFKTTHGAVRPTRESRSYVYDVKGPVGVRTLYKIAALSLDDDPELLRKHQDLLVKLDDMTGMVFNNGAVVHPFRPDNLDQVFGHAVPIKSFGKESILEGSVKRLKDRYGIDLPETESLSRAQKGKMFLVIAPELRKRVAVELSIADSLDFFIDNDTLANDKLRNILNRLRKLYNLTYQAGLAAGEKPLFAGSVLLANQLIDSSVNEGSRFLRTGFRPNTEQEVKVVKR